MTALASQAFLLQGGDHEPHAALLRRIMTPLPEFQLLPAGCAERQQAEFFIRERYQHSYGAQLNHFLPWLLTMRCHDRISAVAGLQPASQGTLYLERYLPAAVEQVLSAALHARVARSSVVETGNLVATRRGASHLLFLLFTSVLHEAGYQWIVFTATQALRNNLRKLGFRTIELCEVDVEAVPLATRQQWGSYYNTEPAVLAGRLEDAAKLVTTGALYRQVANLYRPAIATLARQIKR